MLDLNIFLKKREINFKFIFVIVSGFLNGVYWVS